MNWGKIEKLARLIRYLSLYMSTKAASGHPTSSLSAADLMATLISTNFSYDLKNPNNPGNDRLIFSKGHASPLYYSLFAVMGVIPFKELDNYRKFTSILEGHPTPRFPYTEAATGSLGQGLSIGVGEALAIRMDFAEVGMNFLRTSQRAFLEPARKLSLPAKSSASLTSPVGSKAPRVFVLLGDGEMAEGSTWEAIEIASKYGLDNLVAILDVNRLGQSDETMLGWNVITYRRRVSSFGWATTVIDGHDVDQIQNAYGYIGREKGRPYMIIAKTVKGKGISFIENKSGWHGKPLGEDDFTKAVKELGPVDMKMRILPKKPVKATNSQKEVAGNRKMKTENRGISYYKLGDQVATRKAYGEALAKLGDKYPLVVALDGDVKNSTYSEIFKAKFPERFFEMYIAEQNMVGAAVGLARRGYIPFVSTFAAFLTRAYDQIRMGAISQANIKFCGSHAGVSIGEDGPSQMGLEDIAMFRTIYGCSVLYPADAVATEKLVEEMINDPHMVYMRTTRPVTTVIYGEDEKFPIGGSKIHRLEDKKLRFKKKIVIAAAGITLYEALKAQEELVKSQIEAIVVDCYSVKPIDGKTLRKLGGDTGVILTVEDHWYEGGLGDEVLNEFGDSKDVRVYKLAVCKMPRSGKSGELLDFEDISAKAIVRMVQKIV